MRPLKQLTKAGRREFEQIQVALNKKCTDLIQIQGRLSETAVDSAHTYHVINAMNELREAQKSLAEADRLIQVKLDEDAERGHTEED